MGTRGPFPRRKALARASR